MPRVGNDSNWTSWGENTVCPVLHVCGSGERAQPWQGECPWESFHSDWGLEKSWTNCSHPCFLPLPWLPEVCCVRTVTSLTEPWHLPSLAKSLWDKERKGRGRWEEVVGILTRSCQSPPLDSNLAFGPEKFSIYVKEPDILWIRFGGPTEYFHCARHCA